MQHIKKLLQKRIKQTGLSKNIRTSLLIQEFEKIIPEIIGDSASNKIKPLFIKNGTLTVACLSSAVMAEINLKKQLIINKINKKFDTLALKNIRFIL
ncbi:DUF721 domain-containing protein [Candidatus Falkowbacteria bacterium]|nr:DUF721 domain-containing protein [Candidatus Falkowbacteria bacterium]